MGMQHSTAAPHIMANTALGGQPRTRALLEPDPDTAKRHDDNDLGKRIP
jgi:hypothetical protein